MMGQVIFMDIVVGAVYVQGNDPGGRLAGDDAVPV